MSRFILLLFAVVSVSVLQPVPVMGQDPALHTGAIGGAPFRIQIPSSWNGGLVMYAHGYKGRGAAWTPLNEALSSVFVERGFALAESGYSRQGWAVHEGIEDTEALRQYFLEHYGEPDSTFVTGHSMGGLITLATFESFQGSYVGALPMCGPLLPALQFFEDPVFDMLATFEALFGEFLPQDVLPVVEASFLSAEVVESALTSNQALAKNFAGHWGMRRGDLPSIISMYHLLYRELIDRAGGNPVDNRNTLYSGFDDARELNINVARYSADPAALEYLRRYYTPTGDIQHPVLAVHTTYDAGVPGRLPNLYDVTVSVAGNAEWFSQIWVEADGHCSISPELTGKAFDLLRAWVGEGIRPMLGALR